MDKCFPSPNRPQFPGLLVQTASDTLYCAFLVWTSSRPTLRAISLMTTIGAYNAFVFVLLIAKNAMEDTMCNTKPNGISGHSYWHCFFVCVFLYGSKLRSLLSKIVLAVLVMLHAYNQTITYVGGYHTPRQMIYGAAMGVAAAFFGIFSGKIRSSRVVLSVYAVAIAGLALYCNAFMETPAVMNGAAVIWFPLTLWAVHADNKEKFE